MSAINPQEEPRAGSLTIQAFAALIGDHFSIGGYVFGIRYH